MAKFTHLHVHTEYSLLDGLPKIPKLVAKAKDLGMDALAITDHGALYGAIHFYFACKNQGVKPIIGVEAYYAARSRFDKQASKDSDQHHLLLLAKNEKGYKNLMQLVSIAHLEGYYYKPRIDWEVLQKYGEGLIATSGCMQGEIPTLLREGKTARAEKRAREFQELFGEDYYLELQRHENMPELEEQNKKLVRLSRKLGIPLVATVDVHYIEREDVEAQDTLLTIQTQKKLSDPNRLTMKGSPDYYLRSSEEMSQLFRDLPEAIENTRKITRKANLEIEAGKWILPNYPLPEEETPEEHLRRLVEERLPLRYPKPTQEVLDRVAYELDIVSKRGFATYFLIVQDFVNWAKEEKIRVGPGRGSVAGSIIAYILRITAIDPIEHKLPFERFLNPGRPTPPDIDLDFADLRRDEVIEYVTQKYGRDKVAQIITFGRMEARMAVRDVARVLGHPYATGDRIAKLISFGPQGFQMTIERALKVSPELAAAYNDEEDTRKILDLAKKLEGVARHASTHAAGVVIADKELIEYTPLQKETKGERIITQYDMYALDLNAAMEPNQAIGLLKMDFLGLRNLTILEKTLEYIKSRTGEEVDLSEISLDNEKVFEMLSQGETTGVFQLESAGMRRLAKKLAPSRFSDIAAMVALYRPGPMQFIDEFIARKNAGRVSYPHPDLADILEETYGIAVYQEQCMQIAQVLADYTPSEADRLRLAIGKKKKAVMARERERFIQKAGEKGIKKQTAETIFDLIERFAGYGFNKAHAISYGMIAYQTAWTKANYPVEFMAALLTAESSNADKVSLAISECRRMGIEVLPPDINLSSVGFTIEEKEGSLNDLAIRFGLSAIKNVGKAAIEVILSSRELGGRFDSLSDFCRRVDQQKVNKKVIESLIKAGAMDEFGTRAALLSALDEIRAKASAEAKSKAQGQSQLFEPEDFPGGKKGSGKDVLPDIPEFSKEELLSLERQLLGFYLTEHPLSSVLSIISDLVSHKIFELNPDEHVGNRVKIGGVVTGTRIVTTRNGGQEMVFADLSDDTGAVSLVVFPKLYAATRGIWITNQPILVEGRVDFRQENLSIVVEKVVDLKKQEEEGEEKKFPVIKVPKGTRPRVLVELNDILQKNLGNREVVLEFENDGGMPRRMKLPYGIAWSKRLEEKIKKLF